MRIAPSKRKSVNAMENVMNAGNIIPRPNTKGLFIVKGEKDYPSCLVNKISVCG